jgi:hypothetical protein
MGHVRSVNGRVRIHATGDGYALAAACRLGALDDPRLGSIVETLVRSQWSDGGWNCDPRPAARHSSFHETIGPLWGLAEYARRTGDEAGKIAAERAAEFFLVHRLFRSHISGRIAHPEYARFHYPPYWHYDVLWGLLVLARFGKLGDPRAADAIDLVESKQGADGRWHADGTQVLASAGRGGKHVEVVDWREGGEAEMVTLNALRVLRAAGRLAA